MTNNELEFMKLIFVFFQQLTTLNLAAAAIVPVVAELLPGVHFKTSVLALVCFFVSVVCSCVGMFFTAWSVKGGDNGAPIVVLVLLGIAWFSIVAGVVYFSAVAIRQHT